MTVIWLRIDPGEPVECLSACAIASDLNSASSRIEMEGSVRMHRPEEPCSEDVLGLYPDVVITGFRGEITLVRSDLTEDMPGFASSDGGSTVLPRGRVFVNPEDEYFSLSLFLTDKQYARVLEHARLGSLPERISIHLSMDMRSGSRQKGEGSVSEYEIRYSLDRASTLATRGQSWKRQSDVHQAIVDSTTRFFEKSRDSIDWTLYRESSMATMFAQLLLSAGHQAYSLALLEKEREMLFREAVGICDTVAHCSSNPNVNSPAGGLFWSKKPTGSDVVSNKVPIDSWVPDINLLKLAIGEYFEHELSSPLFEWASIDALCYKALFGHIQEAEPLRGHSSRRWFTSVRGVPPGPKLDVDRIRAAYDYIELSTPPETVRRLLENLAESGVGIDGKVFSLLIRAERRNPEAWWTGAAETAAANMIKEEIRRFSVETS